MSHKPNHRTAWSLGRWLGVILAAIAVPLLAVLCWPKIALGIRPANGAVGGLRIVEVRHPDLRTAEAGVQAHVQEALERVQQARGRSAGERASAWAEMGKVYFAYEIFDAAAGCFTNAAAEDPRNAGAWYGLAESRLEAGEVQGAVAAMREALGRMTSTNGLETVAPVHAHRFLGDALERLGQIAEARAEFEQVLRLAPDDLFSLIKAGQLAAQAGDVAGSIPLLEKALKASPQQRDISFLLAQSLRKAGQTDRADDLLRSFQSTDRTRKIDGLGRPDPWRTSITALGRAAVSMHKQALAAMAAGQHQIASEVLEKVVLREPKYIPSRVSLGYCRLALGEAVRAGELFLAVLREEPKNEPARKGLALALADTDRAPDAIRFCQTWQEQNPASGMAVQTEAEVRMAAREYLEAADAYRRLKKLEPSGVEGPIGLAMALSALGRYEESADTLKEAVRDLEGRAEVRLSLARFLVATPESRIRDPQTALELIRTLINADSLAPVWETYALALAGTGQWEPASEAIQQAVRRLGGTTGTSIARRLAAEKGAIGERGDYLEPFQFADPKLRDRPGK